MPKLQLTILKTLEVEYYGTEQLCRLRTKLQGYWLLCAENTLALAYGFTKLRSLYLETSVSL